MSKNKNSKIKWVITVTFLAFFISLLSLVLLSLAGFVLTVVVSFLLLFIAIGIVFDMVGVAVTSTDEEPLHAMSSKKIKGAKKAVSFKKNADKVSSFCNDVIGDICGIVSGSAGVTIATSLSEKLNTSVLYTGLVITALTAALTIGGKAFFKSIAIKNSNQIVHMTAKVLSIFEKKKK